MDEGCEVIELEYEIEKRRKEQEEQAQIIENVSWQLKRY